MEIEEFTYRMNSSSSFELRFALFKLFSLESLVLQMLRSIVCTLSNIDSSLLRLQSATMFLAKYAVWIKQSHFTQDESGTF